ncbi:DNA repair protein RadC [Faecalicatena sp. AGMB00832]|uniref:DNA repair protein RadC n=1 Tax=Faecalicatena faecalis TaxID=2726362 RepID=A0ABS6D597_9FIRM|nr:MULTISPECIES: DNA repair protein RadC [Faecalicatena]MBU3876778.1 DNA repair protein RadC [Faecalicatena faecalis]MCI6467209.1 DNA repair protein RadC [Faecalicatena sp.]MDY5620214.1 DNA repair protein RadC [Lachnospiraceae bacterium]
MKENNTMKEMVEEERPYEKCMRFGASNLTDSELLAVLLRTGTRGENSLRLADKLLHPAFSTEGILNIHQWTLEQLMQIKGIGKVKAVQILCLSELAKRLSKASALAGLDFSTPSSIAQYYMEDMRHSRQESMKLLLLDTKSRLISDTDISKGTINSAILSPRELFVEALKKNAVSIVLLHNHPSGDPKPSRADVLTTKRVYEAGILIGIELLDHIIIGDNCYYSMREQELLS